MDYEKAYEEALERAKKGLPMDEVFPELCESKDERIMKEIIEYIKSGEHLECYDKCWIDWLERLKEQKPAEWSEKDEKHLSWLIEHFSQDLGLYDNLISWLKSLRPQLHWKPSEEQPEVDLEIQSYIKNIGFNHSGWVELSENDLKDLARHFYEIGLNARKEE